MSIDWGERITAVTASEGLALAGWQRLTGGLTNDSFLLDANEDRWVLRFNADRAGIDREREAAILAQLADSELSPEVKVNRPDRGYLITRFEDRSPWTLEQARDPRRLEDLGRSLRRLHQTPPAVEGRDPVALIAGYLERRAVRAADAEGRIAASVQTLLRDLEGSALSNARPVLCHHDLVHSNILGSVRPLFIDWEYAGAGPALMDLGLYIHYHDLDHDQAEPLLESYFGGPHDAYREDLQLALRAAQGLEWLWLICRAAEGSLPESAASRLRRLQVVWG